MIQKGRTNIRMVVRIIKLFLKMPSKIFYYFFWDLKKNWFKVIL